MKKKKETNFQRTMKNTKLNEFPEDPKKDVDVGIEDDATSEK